LLISAKNIQEKLFLKYPKDLIDQKDVNYLINLLYYGKAFLFDLNLIKNIRLKDDNKSVYDLNDKDKLNKIYTFKLIEDVYKDDQNEIFISFGVFYQSFNYFHRVLRENLDQNKYFLNYTFSFYENESILSGVYVKFKHLLIQIQLVYNRGDFLWIGANDLDTKNVKFFGDTPRALKK
jgi:hypothetical protein